MIDKGIVLRYLDNMLATFEDYGRRNTVVEGIKLLDGSGRSWANGYTLAYREAAARVRNLITAIAVESEQDDEPS